jgi:Ca2+-binding RTX toxin-like protein
VPNTAVYATDVTDSTKNSVYVYGTSAADVIDVHANPTKSGYIDVVMNNVLLGTFTNVFHIYIWGGDGDDKITVQTSAGPIPVSIYGENGNDTITAGTGPAYIEGGLGNDTITGGTARNILVGGAGTDTINGGKDEDILIGGSLDYSEDFYTQNAIMTEWTRTDLTYLQRAANLKAGTGKIPGVVLDSTVITDDGLKDSLFGAQGSDWFFATSLDVTDFKSSGTGADLMN